MKNQALVLALGSLFFGQAYTSEPFAGQTLEQIQPEGETFATEMMQYRVIHYPTYVRTQLEAKDVTKKSLIEINSQNASDVTRAFIDSLGEALEETKTAVGDRLDVAIEQFKDTLKDQKIIAGETAKDLFNILKQRAEEMFPSSDLALSLDEKIRNLKFTMDLGGKLEAVQREPKDICCGILSCILSTSYDYFQRQQSIRTQTTSYPPTYYYPSPGVYSNTSSASLPSAQTSISGLAGVVVQPSSSQ